LYQSGCQWGRPAISGASILLFASLSSGIGNRLAITDQVKWQICADLDDWGGFGQLDTLEMILVRVHVGVLVAPAAIVKFTAAAVSI
jgi:hypothetical protein